MNEKDLESSQESILDFEEAKDLTVGQVKRKNEEVEAGVTDEDSILDKYIKQHREEIEAGKFDTQNFEETPEESHPLNVAFDLDDFAKERHEDRGSEELEAAPDHSADLYETQLAEEAELAPNKSALEIDDLPVEPFVDPSDDSLQEADEEDFESLEVPFYKKKVVLYSVLALFAVTAIGTSLYFTLGRNSGNRTAGSSSVSTTQSSKKSVSSSSKKEASLKEFNDLYASFFTDSSQTAVKNSKFGELESLKAKLEALKGTSDYDAAKTKYDALVKQISAIQSVNSQFDGGAITDGVLNTEAKANADANFSDVSSGNAKLDEVLKAAVAQGRSQIVSAPAPGTDQGGSPATAGGGSGSGTVSNSYTGFGLPSDGVNLQRHLSRVPYNQAAIDDVNNPAWIFNPGVLEKILQTSRERGYITGDQFILEKVNIIKGNGYYNLFKPDGTYLFSINCKTGYFVGNGPGYAEDLDY